MNANAPVRSDGPSPVDSERVARQFALLRAQSDVLAGLSIKARVNALTPLMEAIVRNKDQIVAHIQRETGKTATDALVSEVLGVLDYLHWLKKNASKILRDKKVPAPLLLLGKKAEIWHQPQGVGLIIAPWNYPFHIGMTAIATAFVAGNAVAFKPSEWTPLHGLFESLLVASPLMNQSVRVFPGDGRVGQALIDCRPNRVCFTGSIATGQKIMSHCARYGIPLELELGGKDAAIVFEDVNLDRTVAGVLWGGMTNAGQSCTSIERVYVHQSIYPAFLDRLKNGCKNLVVNHDKNGDADVGALTTDFQQTLVERQLAEAKQVGNKVVCGGQTLPHRRFVLPSIVEITDPDCALWQEETFGPVIALQSFRSEEAVIRDVNALSYGLSASVWSKEIARARRVAEKLQVGAVSINNVMLTEGHPGLPFGGVKASGFGKVKGEEGLLAWVNCKAVMIDKQSAVIEPNWYPYSPRKYQLFVRLIDALFGERGIKRWWRLAWVAVSLDKVSRQASSEP